MKIRTVIHKNKTCKMFCKRNAWTHLFIPKVSKLYIWMWCSSSYIYTVKHTIISPSYNDKYVHKDLVCIPVLQWRRQVDI